MINLIPPSILLAGSLQAATYFNLDFESEPSTTGIQNPSLLGELYWSAAPPSVTQNSLPTFGSSGQAGDDYYYICDNNDDDVRTDRFILTIDGGALSSHTFSYDYHDAFDGIQAGLSDFTDVGITDGTTILVADLISHDGSFNNWQSVSGGFSTSTNWLVFTGSQADFLKGGGPLLTDGLASASQAQIDTIIASDFDLHFAFEQIAGGQLGDNDVTSETIAIDNLFIEANNPAIPEPASYIFLMLGSITFVLNRLR